MRKREDRQRKAKVDAAIRHAERQAKSTGGDKPVLFRPKAGSISKEAPPTSRGVGNRSQREPLNRAMEFALRKTLNISDPQLPASAVDRPKAKAKLVTPAPKRSRNPNVEQKAVKVAPSGKTSKLAQPATSKKKKKKPKQAQPRPVVIAMPIPRKAEPSKDERLRRAAGIAEARLALNARLQARKSDQTATDGSPFYDLQRRWQAAMSYICKFAEANPDAPDVLSAHARLAEIEAEWSHRIALKPGDPDYFPWPSTEAAFGLGAVKADDWQEIGMLSYLGYHVGQSSRLTAEQRVHLLSQVYRMHLPPLNSRLYMQQWGAAQTSQRLRKIAETLAALARNAKRRRSVDFAVAIRDWEADLAYLRRSFYKRRFDFPWPTTAS